MSGKKLSIMVDMYGLLGILAMIKFAWGSVGEVRTTGR